MISLNLSYVQTKKIYLTKKNRKTLSLPLEKRNFGGGLISSWQLKIAKDTELKQIFLLNMLIKEYNFCKISKIQGLIC